MLRCAYRFSPLVAIDRTYDHASNHDSGELCLILDVSGCSRLFKGEKNLARECKKTFEQIADACKITIASTLGIAWANLYYREEELNIILQGDGKAALASLPIEALRLEVKTCISLREVNITSIKELINIPRKNILERFGSEVLRRLDQAFGIRDEPLTAVFFSPICKVEKIFSSAVVQIDVVLFHIESLLKDLMEKLAERKGKLRQITLQMLREDAPPLMQTISLSVASIEVRHIWNVARATFENLPLANGALAITLYVPQVENIQARESSFLRGSELISREMSESQKDAGALFDSLSQRLGLENVFKVECRSSTIPERSYFFSSLKDHTIFSSPHNLEMTLSERPSVLFAQPREVQAMSALPDSPPSWIRWRGEKHEIGFAIGPERIAPEWWGEDLSCTRDYFRSQLADGTWVWLYRELETMKWFLHGFWV